MVRNARPKGGLLAPFGLSLFVFAVTPNAIGSQDIASALAARQETGAHWRQHFRASAFGTIHAATFSFARPIGTAMPRPLSYQLASLDPRILMPAPWDDTAADEDDEPQLQFPAVDRSAKGDRQPVKAPAVAMPKSDKENPAANQVTAAPAIAAQEPAPADEAAAPAEVMPSENGQPSVAVAEDPPTQGTEEPAAASEVEPTSETSETVENPVDIPDPVDTVVAEAESFTFPEPPEPPLEMARLYFGDEPLGDAPGTIEKWAPGEEPVIVAPAAPADPDIKLSALDPKQQSAATKGGESIAAKGEVTGEGKRPVTPAERLSLEGKERTKAEKCLADAVYFESRGEVVRGQIAVAQVVMNRVFSGFYPRNVCGAVYQNKHRRLACQFTFACDGIPETVTDPHAWVRATRIARDVLDGKYWVPEVNRATHYHAYWVRPKWVREMKRLYKIGVHSFYRPRRWGDGSDMPSWGTAEATSEAIAKL